MKEGCWNLTTLVRIDLITFDLLWLALVLLSELWHIDLCKCSPLKLNYFSLFHVVQRQ